MTRRFCPYENALFDGSGFRVVDGTLLHEVDPLHRATDGVLVRIEDGKVIELQPIDAVIEEIVIDEGLE